MILMEGHLPNGMPVYAECEYCGEASAWKPALDTPPQELLEQLKDYIRLHDRKRVVPPPTTLGASSPWSRGRRGRVI